VNRPDLTIVTFERLIDRGVPVPMIGDGMSRFHVRRHDHRASCDTAREFSLMRGWRVDRLAPGEPGMRGLRETDLIASCEHDVAFSLKSLETPNRCCRGAWDRVDSFE